MTHLKSFAIAVCFLLGLTCVHAKAASIADFYNQTVETLDGKNIKMSELKGKVILIVNTASRCGFTPQLTALQSLQEKYGSKGFTVIAFPSNDFKQDEANNEATAKFMTEKYKITFPTALQSKVSGPNKNVTYQYLTEAIPSFPKEVQWNFEKFLVGPDGKVLERFRSMTKPDDKRIIEIIEKNLPKTN